MDPLTWLSLGLQLAALCSIVGALLLYLLRKVRVAEVLPVDSAKTVLVTSVDTALGLQVCHILIILAIKQFYTSINYPLFISYNFELLFYYRKYNFKLEVRPRAN